MKKITNRRLSLFCLDEECKRNYLVTLNQEVTDKGTMIKPVFSHESSEAYAFETTDMAKKYFNFLTENSGFEYFYCILPEFGTEPEKNTEEEKSVDSES